MKQHHVIYLPGLGDQRTWGQSVIVKCWQIFGITTHYQKIGWANNGPFELKLKAVVDKIDFLSSQGFLVSLVGVSAGASAALNAYAARKGKISSVVFISGKILDPKGVNPRYFKLNPAFKESLYLSDTNTGKLSNEDKQKMLYIHALSDSTVPPYSNKPDGVRSKTVAVFGHILGIFVALTFYSRVITDFIKSAH